MFFKTNFPLFAGNTSQARTIPAAITFAAVHLIGLALTVPLAMFLLIFGCIDLAYGASWTPSMPIPAVKVFCFGMVLLYLFHQIITYCQVFAVSRLFGKSVSFRLNSMLNREAGRFLLKEGTLCSIGFFGMAYIRLTYGASI